MVDVSVVFGLVGLAAGMITIVILFLNSEAVQPRFARSNELLAIVVLALLIGNATLLLGALFSIETVPDVVAAAFFFSGVAILLSLVRKTEF